MTPDYAVSGGRENGHFGVSLQKLNAGNWLYAPDAEG